MNRMRCVKIATFNYQTTQTPLIIGPNALPVQSIIGATENLLHTGDAGVVRFSACLVCIYTNLVGYRLLPFSLISERSLLERSKPSRSCSKLHGHYRKRRDGSLAYTAQIRISQKSAPVYQESQAFERKAGRSGMEEASRGLAVRGWCCRAHRSEECRYLVTTCRTGAQPYSSLTSPRLRCLPNAMCDARISYENLGCSPRARCGPTTLRDQLDALLQHVFETQTCKPTSINMPNRTIAIDPCADLFMPIKAQAICNHYRRLREHFGSGNTSSNRQTPYPVLRLVALMNARSHIIANAAISPYRKGEIPLAKDFIESIPSHSVTLLDKGFFSADLLLSIQDIEKNRYWMIPERKGTVRTQLEHYGDGDYLVQMKVSPQARKKNPALPEYWQVRAVTYEVEGKEKTVFTSLPASNRSRRFITSGGKSSWGSGISKARCKTMH